MTTRDEPFYVTIAVALVDTGRFVFGQPLRLVALSLAWTAACLPLATIGPATVGAHASIAALEEQEFPASFPTRDVLRRVREQFVPAVLLSGLPLVAGAGTALIALRFFRTGSALAGMLTVLSLYIWLYLVVVLIPTFVLLAEGEDAFSAVTEAWQWTRRQPTIAVLTLVVTGMIAAVTAITTIGFGLLFPAFAFTYHRRILSPPSDSGDGR